MYLRLLTSLLFLSSLTSLVCGQTFVGSGGPISDNLDTTYFSLNVSGLSPSTLDKNFGLEEICINILHTRDADLDIYLESPNGTIVELTTDNGAAGDNYQTTCFRQDVGNLVVGALAPFNGNFMAEGMITKFNNGQAGSGTWRLRIYDDLNTGGQTGNVVDWKLKFSNTPAAAPTLDSSNLAIIVINTGGVDIPDEPKIMADMGIIWHGPGVMNYMTDTFNHYNGKIGIEQRGSSSAVKFPKKSFGLETRYADSTSLDTFLLGMPQENDWVLSASFTDKTFLRNVIAYQIFRNAGRYASRFEFCELVIDGEYRGVYVLMEKVKRNKNRVDISKLHTWENAGDSLTGGYIVKIDKPTGGGGGTGWTSPYPPTNGNGSQSVFFQYDYPKPDSITPQQQNYIQQYVDSFETALNGPNFSDTMSGYARYCDPASFIDYFILNELSANTDGYRLSTYLHKDKFSKGGKLVIGPPWDYDIAFGNANYCGAPAYNSWDYDAFGKQCPTDPWQVPFWWQRLLQDSNFTNNLQCRWLQLRDSIIDTTRLFSWIDSAATLVTPGVTRNFTFWPILGSYVWPNPNPIPTDYPGEIAALKQWISNRINWLDINMPGTCLNPTGMNELHHANELRIFPNPGRDHYWVEGASYTKLEVYNMKGLKIRRSNQASGSADIDLTGEPCGIYLVRIYSGDKSVGYKIIKAD